MKDCEIEGEVKNQAQYCFLVKKMNRNRHEYNLDEKFDILRIKIGLREKPTGMSERRRRFEKKGKIFLKP